MSDLVDLLGNTLPDLAILAISALAFALFGGTVAYLANRIWFRRWPGHSAFEDKLADTAHASLLGLSAFVLALMVTNGLMSLAKTNDNVLQEGVAIYRLGRELDALGAQAQDAKAALAAYARNVGKDEWRRLGTAPTSLSPLAERNLDDLWTALRAIQKDLDVADPRRGDLSHYADQIETLRQSRLANSSSSVPGIFWLILIAYVSSISFIAGRESPKRFGTQVNMVHMSAIGLAVGLVIILDNPFRGQTSVDPAIIMNALTR